MLGHRLRRWPNINTALYKRLVFAGVRALCWQSPSVRQTFLIYLSSGSRIIDLTVSDPGGDCVYSWGYPVTLGYPWDSVKRPGPVRIQVVKLWWQGAAVILHHTDPCAAPPTLDPEHIVYHQTGEYNIIDKRRLLIGNLIFLSIFDVCTINVYLY